MASSSAEEVELALNQVTSDIWGRPGWMEFIADRLGALRRPVALLGDISRTDSLAALVSERGGQATTVQWDWHATAGPGPVPPDCELVVCEVPVRAAQWWVLLRMREQHPGRVTALHELVLPLTALEYGLDVLQYSAETMDDIAPFYTGRQYAGPIDALDELVEISGKTVVEFGPMDGLQTAGLLRAGASEVTCIEARAENMLKMLVAAHALGWDNVRLVMDDFHNAHSNRYGRFDIAFAHGVYYHSNAPFVFLENLVSLSDLIFVGGFCATESLPEGDFEVLEHARQQYRAKRYSENAVESFVRGVNEEGWLFDAGDLLKFFELRGCETVVIAESEPTAFAGKYLHFLARRKAGGQT